jgi:hypothetical protein
MQQNPEHISSLGSRLASYLAVERKKAIVAACLIMVMGFMWIKLLTGKGEPAAAVAADYVQPLPGSAPVDSVIIYGEPPFVAGRNDTLARDFFSPGDWQAFLIKSSSQQSSFVAIGQTQIADDDIRSKTIRQIADGLKLQIMEIGTEPQAFVSDTLVKEGSTLTIAAGETAFDFKVLRVTRKSVELECDGMTFEIKLKEK